MLVPKLPHKPSAPELHGVGCKAALRLPGSVKDLWKSQRAQLSFCLLPFDAESVGSSGMQKGFVKAILASQVTHYCVLTH